MEHCGKSLARTIVGSPKVTGAPDWSGNFAGPAQLVRRLQLRRPVVVPGLSSNGADVADVQFSTV